MDNVDPNGVQAVAQTSGEAPATPELNATPDGQQLSTIDPAEIEALRQRASQADQLESQLGSLAQQQQRYEQQLAQQAAAAWRAEEQQMLQRASQMDPEQALQAQAQFYRQREQAIVGMNQQQAQQIHQERLNAWVHEHVREHGLTQQDGQRLYMVAMQNPNAVPDEAKRIKAERSTSTSEIDQLKQQVEQLTRAQQAEQIVQSGAWQTGGTNPRPVNPDIKPGSIDGFKQALAGTAGFPG